MCRASVWCTHQSYLGSVFAIFVVVVCEFARVFFFVVAAVVVVVVVVCVVVLIAIYVCFCAFHLVSLFVFALLGQLLAYFDLLYVHFDHTHTHTYIHTHTHTHTDARTHTHTTHTPPPPPYTRTRTHTQHTIRIGLMRKKEK